LCTIQKYKKNKDPVLIRNYTIIKLIVFALFALSACNPNRDRWINRKWHTLTGHYNIFFNGEEKLREAILQIEKSHVNDFTKVLDVYPMGTEQSAKAAGNLLDQAMKKFSGTIQLHTVGSYTDDAYFNIGKTHFYKQDYFAALEMFQFVGTKYKHLGYTNITTNYIARCYLGLKKPTEAEAIMGLLLSKNDVSKKDVGEIYATAAEVNIQLQKYKPAIDLLQKALTAKLTKDKKIRYHFILGQLYLLDDNKPKSAAHFQKVVSLLPNYEFEFNANINLTRLYNPNDKKSIAKVRRNLKRMAGDDKNEEFRDQIYYELGKLEMAAKNFDAAVDNFKKSVAFSTKNKNQKALSYLELAKHYFNTKSYENAKAYYDSTVQTLDKKYKDYENISKTKTVLTELINNLTVYETEDSLQRLSLLSKNALEQRIDAWIADKKKRDDLAAKLAKKQKYIQESMQQNQFNTGGTNVNNFPGSDGSWYFYNAQMVSTGTADFYSNRKWGQRKNEDFWRIAAKEKPLVEEESDEAKTKTTANKEKEQNTEEGGDENKPVKEVKEEVNKILTGNKDKDAWIKNVPFTAQQKKKSDARMLEALNNLGMIYYDKLQEPKECIKYYNIMQAKFPASEYEPNAYYYLFKALNDIKDFSNANKNKELLINTYPEHPYSLLLQNKAPKNIVDNSNKELLLAYEKAYDAYANGNYTEAINLKANASKTFPGNNLRPRFELLEAFCNIKLGKQEDAKKQLNNIVQDFANTPEAERAAELLKSMNKQERLAEVIAKDATGLANQFDIATDVPHYFIFAIKNQKADFTEYNSKFSDYNQDYASNDNLRCNAMLSNDGFQFILIREFPNLAKAYNYHKGIIATKFIENKLKVTEPYICYAISTANFKKVLKENKLEAFEKFYQQQVEELQKKNNN
jgi:tetratricopeptide (TPR) repeat protein